MEVPCLAVGRASFNGFVAATSLQLPARSASVPCKPTRSSDACRTCQRLVMALRASPSMRASSSCPAEIRYPARSVVVMMTGVSLRRVLIVSDGLRFGNRRCSRRG